MVFDSQDTDNFFNLVNSSQTLIDQFKSSQPKHDPTTTTTTTTTALPPVDWVQMNKDLIECVKKLLAEKASQPNPVLTTLKTIQDDMKVLKEKSKFLKKAVYDIFELCAEIKNKKEARLLIENLRRKETRKRKRDEDETEDEEEVFTNNGKRKSLPRNRL